MEAIPTPKARTLSTATVDRASVESILTRHDSTASMHPAPMEHVGSPTTSRTAGNTDENVSVDEPPTSPVIPRSRPASYISAKNKANRLSLSFPVQLPANYQTNTSSGNDLMSETSTGTLFHSQTPNAAAEPPNDFLQELARQERRVLELKEELGKAEGELEGLKRKWALREAHKKRSEIRAVEQMVPYSPKTASAGEEGDGSEVRRSAEMTADRRKALLLSGIGRESRRKVMEGRHTRTLSLLSPERSNFGPNSPFSPLVPGSATFSTSYNATNSVKSPTSPESTTINGCVPLNVGIARSATLPDLPNHLFKPRNRHSYHNTTSGSGVGSANEVLKTGKRLAEDLKAGLWTFVEDLRQATVGEEAINSNVVRARNIGTTTNTQYMGGTGYGAVNSLSTTPKSKGIKAQGDKKSPIVERDYTRDLHELIPDEAILPSTEPASQPKRKSITAPQQEDLTADDWLNWDSPASTAPSSSSKTTAAGEEESQRWSSSTFATDVCGDLGVDGTPSRIGANSGLGLSLGGGNVRGGGARKEEVGGNGNIQWPALKPFSPSSLKKTAESLMREWEKSLTPPPEEDEEEGADAVRGQSPVRVGGYEEHHDLLR